MGIESGLLVAGMGMQIYGQREANKAQAKAEKLNAAEYQEQKRLAALSAMREGDIFLADSAAFMGDQISGIAKAGINIDGSALMALANMQSSMDREYQAIKTGAQIRASMFDSRSKQASDTSRMLSSNSFNNTQTLGTLLNGASSYMEMSRQQSISAGLEGGSSGGHRVSSNSWPGTEYRSTNFGATVRR